jgi:Cys-rich repeat protein
MKRAVLIALLAIAACKKGGDAAPPPQCATESDCTGGLICSAGQCAPCAKSSDCAITEACDPVAHTCAFRACWGNECKQHSDCSLGAFCVQGLCINPSTLRTSGGETCSVVVCGKDSDCNVGQRCNERTFVCEENLGCLANSPCGAGQVCNPGTSQCEAGCSASTDCGALLKCEAGRCVQCAQDADCGTGLVCDVAAGVCQGPLGCASSRDCASPQICDRATSICAAPRGPCTSNETCSTDQRCDTRTGTCVAGACLADRFAPDGDQAHAAPLQPGSFPSLTLCGPTEQDWFSVLLRSGDTVQVVASVDPLGSFDLQLLDAAGDVLDESASAVLATVGSTATYFVRARTNDASALYGLRLDVAHGIACAHSPSAPHPDPADALAIAAGDNFDFAVCPGEETWFVVRPPAGDGIDLTGTLDPTAGGALGLSLFDSDGTTQLSDDATGSPAPRVAAALSSGGQFFLRVRGVMPTARNRYDLRVRYTLP